MMVVKYGLVYVDRYLSGAAEFETVSISPRLDCLCAGSWVIILTSSTLARDHRWVRL